ncbi:MAG: DUF1697 domain-containing protein [Patescibacteria group bacterium]
MTSYIAFLRGIMPTNPNMRNEKLRAVFERLGFTNVQSVISSGNIIFHSDSKNVSELEEKIEETLLKELSIKSPAYVRSKANLERLIAKDPFPGATHSKTTYLIVSFLKQKPGEIFTVVDTTDTGSTKFMSDIDKRYSKNVTTRTWKTVERVLVRMK